MIGVQNHIALMPIQDPFVNHEAPEEVFQLAQIAVNLNGGATTTHIHLFWDRTDGMVILNYNQDQYCKIRGETTLNQILHQLFNQNNQHTFRLTDRWAAYDENGFDDDHLIFHSHLGTLRNKHQAFSLDICREL